MQEHHDHHHDHDHNCETGACPVHGHHHDHTAGAHQHQHDHHHSHQDDSVTGHSVSTWDSIKNLLTITNGILVAITFAFDQVLGYLTARLAPAPDSTPQRQRNIFMFDLAAYWTQMMGGMAVWSTLAKLLPQIHLTDNKWSVEHTELITKHQHKLLPATSEAIRTAKWSYMLLVSTAVTAIEALKKYIESHLQKNTPQWQHLSLTVGDQLAKIFAIIVTDSWFHNRQITLSSFWQSLTVDVCECHGAPRLACPSNLAPLITQSIDALRSYAGYNTYASLTQPSSAANNSQ